MLVSKFKVSPTLKISKILAELFQGAIYDILPKERHDSINLNGKKFKESSFRVVFNSYDGVIDFRFTSLCDEDEKNLLIALQNNVFSIGDIKNELLEVKIINRDTDKNEIFCTGYVVFYTTKDKKKSFLEPKTQTFKQNIKRNSLQKYQAIYKKEYEGEFNIRLLNQKLKPKFFYYKKAPTVSWFATYQIEANSDMLNLLLRSGLGSGTMKNTGFLDLVDML